MLRIESQPNKYSGKKLLTKEEKGFGLLESIISAMILAVVIATSVSVTNKYQVLNYRSSLRQAIAQTIDEDLTEMKLELESYLYQAKTKALGACYASSKNCQQSTIGVGQCNKIAAYAVRASSIIKTGVVRLDAQTHQVFKGLEKNPSSDLKRVVSLEKPEAPKQVSQTISLIDESIVRIQYTLEGELANTLFDSRAKKIIGSIDLSPPAHSSCQYK